MKNQLFDDASVAQVQGKRIVKHFKKDDLKYFKAGQIRFGTLAEYRGEEEKQGLGAR